MRTRRYTQSERRKKGVSRAGTAIVEFALVALVFFMVLFGIMEFGRLMLMYHFVGNAAREGSRWAIVHGKDSPAPATQVDVRNHVWEITPLDNTNVQVETWWQNDNNAQGNWVKVRVTYPFHFVLPIWYGGDINLTSTSEMVISY